MASKEGGKKKGGSEAMISKKYSMGSSCFGKVTKREEGGREKMREANRKDSKQLC